MYAAILFPRVSPARLYSPKQCRFRRPNSLSLRCIMRDNRDQLSLITNSRTHQGNQGERPRKNFFLTSFPHSVAFCMHISLRLTVYHSLLFSLLHFTTAASLHLTRFHSYSRDDRLARESRNRDERCLLSRCNHYHWFPGGPGIHGYLLSLFSVSLYLSLLLSPSLSAFSSPPLGTFAADFLARCHCRSLFPSPLHSVTAR